MLYERIKELSREKGVTITKVEADLGFGRGSLSKIDKHKPSNEKIKMIADYFGVSQDDLTGVQSFGQHESYYINEDTVKMAQKLSDNPYMRILFDAAEDSRPEHLQMAADILTRLKKTNPDG